MLYDLHARIPFLWSSHCVCRDLNGVIVMLSDTGRLECVYLGTDPAIFVPPQVDSRELNYAKMDAEMVRLQQRIKEKGNKAGWCFHGCILFVFVTAVFRWSQMQHTHYIVIIIIIMSVFLERFSM